jgi:hypothetical protein
MDAFLWLAEVGKRRDRLFITPSHLVYYNVGHEERAFEAQALNRPRDRQFIT